MIGILTLASCDSGVEFEAREAGWSRWIDGVRMIEKAVGLEVMDGGAMNQEKLMWKLSHLYRGGKAG